MWGFFNSFTPDLRDIFVLLSSSSNSFYNTNYGIKCFFYVKFLNSLKLLKWVWEVSFVAEGKNNGLIISARDPPSVFFRKFLLEYIALVSWRKEEVELTEWLSLIRLLNSSMLFRIAFVDLLILLLVLEKFVGYTIFYILDLQFSSLSLHYCISWVILSFVGFLNKFSLVKDFIVWFHSFFRLQQDTIWNQMLYP